MKRRSGVLVYRHPHWVEHEPDPAIVDSFIHGLNAGLGLVAAILLGMLLIVGIGAVVP